MEKWQFVEVVFLSPRWKRCGASESRGGVLTHDTSVACAVALLRPFLKALQGGPREMSEEHCSSRLFMIFLILALELLYNQEQQEKDNDIQL